MSKTWLWRDCKYVRFEMADGAILSANADTDKSHRRFYHVCNKQSGDVLGYVYWYFRWRQWVFGSKSEVVWSADCLADVQGFLKWLAGGGGMETP